MMLLFDVLKCNPTITVCLVKFNFTITAYLVPYIREGYSNQGFCQIDESACYICTCACGITAVTYSLCVAKKYILYAGIDIPDKLWIPL